MHGTRKTLRELKAVAAKYHLVFDGKTSKGHWKWLHTPTGRTVTSISCFVDRRSIANVERTFKRRIRELTEQGVYDGSDSSD